MVCIEKPHDICKIGSHLLTLLNSKKQTDMDATFANGISSMKRMLPVCAFNS